MMEFLNNLIYSFISTTHLSHMYLYTNHISVTLHYSKFFARKAMEEALFEAITKADYGACEQLLRRGANIEAIDKEVSVNES